MKQLIAFPQLGNYFNPLRKLITNTTHLKVIEMPKITKKTISLGSKNSPDTVCVPFKYNLGNFIEALDKGATVLFQAGGGCRYRYYEIFIFFTAICIKRIVKTIIKRKIGLYPKIDPLQK